MGKCRKKERREGRNKERRKDAVSRHKGGRE
jgi:hypothetical protein